jgi:TonB-dependent SusC/RagA subfamily outer membrane receptor
MCSAHAHRLLGVLLGFTAACSHQQNATGEGRAGEVSPASAVPHSVMTSEEIERAPGRSIAQLLSDRFPGVTVTERSDGGLSIRIRGVSSLMSNNQPLCMVDDVPIDIEHGAGLRAINPHDIASIEVVQDPAGMAMYGVRGANGVIVIRTKRPGQ